MTVQFISAVLLPCLLVATACTSAPIEPESAPGADADPLAALAADSEVMTHRWTAPAGIDLDAPEIQVARAYFESEWRFWRTADITATYPGYEDVQEEWITSPHPRSGTVDHHLLEVRTTTHHGRPATEVHICNDYMNTAEPTDTGWVRRDSYRYQSLRIQQTNWNSTSRPALDYDRRMPYPTWNVFDGWDVHWFTDYRNGGSGPRGICYLHMPEFDYDAPLTARVPAPPSVEPFHPGWPTAIESEN